MHSDKRYIARWEEAIGDRLSTTVTCISVLKLVLKFCYLLLSGSYCSSSSVHGQLNALYRKAAKHFLLLMSSANQSALLLRSSLVEGGKGIVPENRGTDDQKKVHSTS